MQSRSERDQPRPTIDGFGGQMRKTVERYAGILLALALLTALWSTALGRLSEQSTAETLLTRAGTDIINPVLIANGSGIGDAFYQQLQTNAKAHPNDALSISFLKLGVPGKAIAGKSFADGSRVIYAAVADAYYRLGPGGVFVLPPQLQQVVSGYTPFVQQASGIKSPLPSLPIPQLPAFAAQLYTAVGITPTTLTAQGHADATARSLWLWLISGVLALILVLLNTGWDRLWSIAWPLFHSSWHIALLGVIATVIVNVRAAQAKPYLPILSLIGGTFMIVFYVAAVLGIVLVIVSMVGNRLAPAGKAKDAPREAAPVLAGAAPMYGAASTMPPSAGYGNTGGYSSTAPSYPSAADAGYAPPASPYGNQTPLGYPPAPPENDAPPPRYPGQNPLRP